MLSALLTARSPELQSRIDWADIWFCAVDWETHDIVNRISFYCKTHNIETKTINLIKFFSGKRENKQVRHTRPFGTVLFIVKSG